LLYGWIIPHVVYISHFLFPFINWYTFRMIP
jgi:hypothetical protein